MRRYLDVQRILILMGVLVVALAALCNFIGSGHYGTALLVGIGMLSFWKIMGEEVSVNNTCLYISYDQLPYYRKQWFFWLMFFTINPVAFAILSFGDVYYQKKDEVKYFGSCNRLMEFGIFALYILLFGMVIYSVFNPDWLPLNRDL